MLDLYANLEPWMRHATDFVLLVLALAAYHAMLDLLDGDD